jgi:hypothetical protein
MGVHTMKEATAGLTPQEVWVRRDVYRNIRRILIDPSTVWEWGRGGYLERIEFSLAGTRYVLTSNGDNGEIGDMLYLAFDSAARLIKMEEWHDEHKKRLAEAQKAKRAARRKERMKRKRNENSAQADH